MGMLACRLAALESERARRRRASVGAGRYNARFSFSDFPFQIKACPGGSRSTAYRATRGHAKDVTAEDVDPVLTVSRMRASTFVKRSPRRASSSRARLVSERFRGGDSGKPAAAKPDARDGAGQWRCRRREPTDRIRRRRQDEALLCRERGFAPAQPAVGPSERAAARGIELKKTSCRVLVWLPLAITIWVMQPRSVMPTAVSDGSSNAGFARTCRAPGRLSIC